MQRQLLSILIVQQKLCLGLVALVLAPCVQAQFFERLFTPRIAVQIKHPPSLLLKIERVVFGITSGACSEDLVEDVLAGLVDHGIEVLDRQNFSDVLAEQELSLSGPVDKTTAVKLGKIIGPAVMLNIKVSRCANKQNKNLKEDTVKKEDEEGNAYSVQVYKYFSKTEASIRTSVQAIDLARGRIFAARPLKGYAKDTNTGSTWYPEYPDRYVIKKEALDEVTIKIKRMFIPWTESRALTFYENAACNLGSAYRAILANDFDQALALSQTNLEKCKSYPKIGFKVLSQAYYNLGMVNMMLGQFEPAMENLSAAAQVRPGYLVRKAISSTQEAWNSKHIFEIIEADAALTNSDITGMIAQGVPAAVIIKLIQSKQARFDISVKALAALSSAKVSGKIVRAMKQPSE